MGESERRLFFIMLSTARRATNACRAHGSRYAAHQARAQSTMRQQVIDEELLDRQNEIAEVERWWESPRWKHTKWTYDASSVVALRGSIKMDYASNVTAKKAYASFREMFAKGECTATFGSLDTIQVTQMAKYLDTIYVSGWQSSSTASTSNEPGPDIADYPNQMLAYNLSPSFNWDAANMTDDQMETFIKDLGKLGYTWQFITLAGFHCNALGIDNFAKDYAKRGMRAYVEGIQREERRLGVETLTHQKWSGAQLIDAHLSTLQSASSTLAMGAGVTEAQFKNSMSDPDRVYKSREQRLKEHGH